MIALNNVLGKALSIIVIIGSIFVIFHVYRETQYFITTITFHEPDSGIQTQQANTPESDLSQIASLFGSSPAVGDIPLSQLQWKLIALFVHDDPALSKAIIEVQAQQNSYVIGDEVASNITIKAIYPDRVILERGHHLESLLLDPDPLEVEAIGDAKFNTHEPLE